MGGRRARTVRIVAASGIAAALMGLMAPMPRLLAQKAEATQKPAEAGATTPEVPPAKQADGAPISPPTPSEPDPPKMPEPATPSEKPVARTPDDTLADPEAAAQAFVERSQKEADQAINTLSQEAEALRARLRKVEAGLARWQAVKESLGAATGSGAARPSWRRRGGDPDAAPAPAIDPARRGEEAPAPVGPGSPSAGPSDKSPARAAARDVTPRPSSEPTRLEDRPDIKGPHPGGIDPAATEPNRPG